MPILFAILCQHGYVDHIKGVLTIDNLLLNSPASHHSRAFGNLKKEYPDQVDLLVSKDNSGEMVMRISKQPASIQKNTEQNAHYLLTILTKQEI